MTTAEVDGDPSMSHLVEKKKYWVKWDDGRATALIERSIISRSFWIGDLQTLNQTVCNITRP